MRGKILIAEHFLESISLLSMSQLCNKREALTHLHRIISEQRWHLTQQYTIMTAPADLTCYPNDSFRRVHPELNHIIATQFEGWNGSVYQFCASNNNHLDTKCVVDPANTNKDLTQMLD